MKRIFGLRSLILGFFLTGAMLLFTQSAQAQTIDPTNWMSEPEAITLIEPLLIDLGEQILSLQPGTNDYNVLEARLGMYKLIYQHLNDGDVVPQAVVRSVNEVELSITDSDPAQEAFRNQLYNEAASLLSI